MAKSNTKTSYAEEGLEAVNADTAQAEAALTNTADNSGSDEELQQVGGLEPVAFFYRTSAPKNPGKTKSAYKVLAKGDEITGTYERAFVNGKYKNPTYIIRNTEGQLVGLSGTGSLNRAMDKLEVGSKLKITYGGMSAIKSGEWAGSDAHNFTVFGNKFKA